MPVELGDLDIELQIGDENFEIEKNQKQNFKNVFSTDKQSSISILGFCRLDDSRIPSVSVSTCTWFMYGPRGGGGVVSLFHSLLQRCIKKRKGFFVSIQIQRTSQFQKLSFALPNRELNCFELIDLPSQDQRKNSENFENSENCQKPSDQMVKVAENYVESLPKINLNKIHHPNISSYHEELKYSTENSDIFVPENIFSKICPPTEEAAGLIQAHGIFASIGKPEKSEKKGLDDETVRTICQSGNYGKITVAALREYCKRNGLSSDGRKNALIERVLQ